MQSAFRVISYFIQGDSIQDSLQRPVGHFHYISHICLVFTVDQLSYNSPKYESQCTEPCALKKNILKPKQHKVLQNPLKQKTLNFNRHLKRINWVLEKDLLRWILTRICSVSWSGALIQNADTTQFHLGFVWNSKNIRFEQNLNLVKQFLITLCFTMFDEIFRLGAHLEGKKRTVQSHYEYLLLRNGKLHAAYCK